MGLCKRRLYKPERKPARKKGVLYNQAPIGLIDATKFEVTAAIVTLAYLAGVDAGQGVGYESIRDEYTIAGKSRETGKAQDFKVEGATVADLIKTTRILNGGKMGKFDARQL